MVLLFSQLFVVTAGNGAIDFDSAAELSLKWTQPAPVRFFLLRLIVYFIVSTHGAFKVLLLSLNSVIFHKSKTNKRAEQ